MRLILFILLLCCSSAEASYLDSPRIIRVGLTILGRPQTFSIEPSTGFIEMFDKSKNQSVYSGKAAKVDVSLLKDGKMKVDIDNRKTLYYVNNEILFSANGRAPVNLKVKAGGKKSYAYRGTIGLSPNRGGLLAVNLVDMEDYLKSVVPCEISTCAPDAAQEAQAIAARTYAIRHIGKHGNGDRYQVCDTVHCQVYAGIVKEVNIASKAIKRTDGQILSFAGAPANTVYHSNCGGYLISSKAAWSGSEIPYLSGHFDGVVGEEPFCSHGISLKKKQPTGRLPKPDFKLKPKLLPWSAKKLHHKSHGHRVGMCQDGAIGMAAIGYNSRQILAFYYSNTKIETLKYAGPNINSPYEPSPEPVVVAMKPETELIPLETPLNPTQINALTRNSQTNEPRKTGIISTLKEISTVRVGSTAKGIRKMFWTPTQPELSSNRSFF